VGASSYVWSTTETTSLITVYNGGTYTVSGTDFHGCVNTHQEVFTESVPPAAPILSTAGPIYLCSGDGGGSFTSVPLCVTNYNNHLLWSTGFDTTQCIGINYIDVFNVTYTDPQGCSTV